MPLIEIDDHLKEGNYACSLSQDIYSLPRYKSERQQRWDDITVGRKGFHLNFSKHGVRQTTGLPGPGISHTSYLYKTDDDEDDEKDKKETEERSESKAEEKPKRERRRRTVREHASSPWGFFVFVLVALFFIYFGGQALGLLPPSLITDFLSTLTQWVRQVGL